MVKSRKSALQRVLDRYLILLKNAQKRQSLQEKVLCFCPPSASHLPNCGLLSAKDLAKLGICLGHGKLLKKEEKLFSDLKQIHEAPAPTEEQQQVFINSEMTHFIHRTSQNERRRSKRSLPKGRGTRQILSNQQMMGLSLQTMS